VNFKARVIKGRLAHGKRRWIIVDHQHFHAVAHNFACPKTRERTILQ
jgi:hypothetical protein